jgi:hypothetical protein
MSEFKEYLIMISLLVVPVGISLIQVWIRQWFYKANIDDRNKLSGLWHGAAWWTITLSTLNIFWAHNLVDWFQYLPLIMCIFWILFDLWWNWRHRKTIRQNWPLYPGNGKGGFIESSVFWVSKRLGLNFTITMVIIKLVGIGVSIFIAIKF